uniref:IL-8 receptor-like G protein coupled receptor homolog n=1 Tax=Human herpesvirus 8 TaxID=37296 RepID=Q9QEV2_HHV8|nr:IL-8 receptor-like G protein coupled receptor homolog [Human gammaherpesvirus 8]
MAAEDFLTIFLDDDESWNETLNMSGYDYSGNFSLEVSVCEMTTVVPYTWNVGILSLIFLINVLGNGLVTYIFCKHRSRAGAIDILLLGICLNSLCLSISLLAEVLMFLFPNIISTGLCRLEIFFYYLYVYLDIFSVVCVSLVRYLLVAYSTRSWPKKQSLGWVLTSAAPLIALVLSGDACRHRSRVVDPVSKQAMCYENAGNMTADWRLHVRTVSVTAGFLLPLALLILFYALTWCVVRRTKLQARRKVRGVIVAVVLLFFVFCFPYHVLNLLDTLLRRRWIRDSCYTRGLINVGLAVTSLLQALYSAVVPLIYSCLGSLFRQRMYGLFQSLRQSFMSGATT